MEIQRKEAQQASEGPQHGTHKGRASAGARAQADVQRSGGQRVQAPGQDGLRRAHL